LRTRARAARVCRDAAARCGGYGDHAAAHGRVSVLSLQLQLIGSERDADIVRAVRAPGFFQPWGDPIRWDSLEQTEVEKSVWLNRWYFVPSFGRQYFLTGDPALLRDTVAFVRRWRAENPRPTDLQAYIRSRQRNWRDMQVAWRVQNLAWFYFLAAEGLSVAEKREFFACIDEHASVLLEDFGTRPFNENNHQSHGAATMLFAALLFPEVRHADELRAKALAILDHHLAQAFYDDGNSVELAPGYFPFFVSIFRDAYLLCRANGVPPPARALERLAQFQRYLGIVAQPDGTMPPINDSSESASGPALDVLASVLGRAAPAAGSHWFAASHQAVLRDAGAPAPAYVFLDAGPQTAAHWHAGKLGFQLWHWDRPLLVDSGVSNYDDPLKRSWYWTAAAHNTLLIDGAGDHDRNKLVTTQQPDGGSRIRHWESNERYDWAVMTHAGFANRPVAVAWTRHFVLVKGVGSVVLDQVSSAGEHDYTWLFHLAAEAPAERAPGGGVFTGFPDRNLLLQPAGAEALQLELRAGHVNRGSRNFPAPVAAFSRRGAALAQAFLLLPEHGAHAPAARITQSDTAAGTRLEIALPHRPAVSLEFAEGAPGRATPTLLLTTR
jgi:hypothetical protein